MLTYDRRVFNVKSMAHARAVILTPEDSSTEERWKNETPYLASLIGEQLQISSDWLLLDYGCGIGRIAKELIARHGCQVIGVEISPSMQALAPVYVASDRFLACSPTILDSLVRRGLSFNGAFSVYVLQHCQYPAQDIARIRRALRQDGRLFVLNDHGRCVPTVERGWIDDGLDIRSELGREFKLLADGEPALDHTCRKIATSTFWATFQRP